MVAAQPPRRASVLVIDDEDDARAELCAMLRTGLGVARVEAARDSTEALRHLQRRRFDVVFTEVAIPGLTGIEVASLLHQFAAPPAVVFVTGHGEHAVRAFEVGACDYLLKPVSRPRLAQALDRALRQLPERPSPPAVTSPPPSERADEGTPAGDPPPATIPVDAGGRTRLIPRQAVRYAEAHGDYVRLHLADGETHLIRVPISRLEEAWEGFGFIRIHRAYLAPIAHITEYSSVGGHHTVTVAGQVLPVSRRHVRDVRDRFPRFSSPNVRR